MLRLATRDLVAVGGSAGGVEALGEFVARLPPDLPAAVLVVVHIPARSSSLLPAILGRRGPLPCHHAEDGERITPGHIYVGPPDRHLHIHQDAIALRRSRRQNGVRPAVDALFRSAARWAGPRTIAVVLSGMLDDGAAGLAAVRLAGGLALVQDPADALFGGMPCAALAAVAGDAVVRPAAGLAGYVAEAAGTPVRPAG